MCRWLLNLYPQPRFRVHFTSAWQTFTWCQQTPWTQHIQKLLIYAYPNLLHLQISPSQKQLTPTILVGEGKTYSHPWINTIPPYPASQQIFLALYFKNTQNSSTSHLSASLLIQANLIAHLDYCNSLLSGLFAFGLILAAKRVLWNLSQVTTFLCANPPVVSCSLLKIKLLTVVQAPT